LSVELAAGETVGILGGGEKPFISGGTAEAL